MSEISSGTVLITGPAGGLGRRSCAVQPLLMLRYGVVSLGLNGSASPGQQVVRVSARCRG